MGSQVLPKIQLLEDLAGDSQKMFTSMTTLIEDLEYEQKEEKIKTMMNIMSGMHTARRLSQVEMNSSSEKLKQFMAQQTDNMAVMENRLMTITGLMGQRINNFSAKLSRLHPYGVYVASSTE